MKAFVYDTYGSPDVLRCEEIEKPKPGNDEVLIRVRAASVNPLDWHYMRGTPYLIRIGAGLRAPANPRLGVDLAGTVEAVGTNVTTFRPGDDVFGAGRGAFAEYVCAKEGKVALKPSNATFEQAAAVPIAALTALQGLRDKGRIEPGQRVLFNGAAGGVGTFAVQIARAFGADVTGVCSRRNVDMVRSIGADHVIDYEQEDFTRTGLRYDLILDSVGNHALSECRRSLTTKGTLVIVGGPDNGGWLGPLADVLGVLVQSWFVSQRLVVFVASLNQPDLAVLKELIESGKVTPVIDRSYPLSELPEAIRYLEAGHARGKVVVRPGA